MIAATAIALAVAACEDKQAKESLQTAKDAGGKLGELLAKGKDAVIKTAKDQAASLDVVISDLKEATGKQSGELKDELTDQLAALERMRASLAQKLEPLTNAQGEGWKEIAKEYDDVVARMRRTIEEIRAALKK